MNTVVQNNEIVKTGYLTKSPPDDAPSISQWRRRWFVLRDSLRSYPLAERYIRLEYYQSESDARKLADPKGIINLTDCTRVSISAPVKGHKFVLDVHTRDRNYHLAADTPSERQEWIVILNDVLFSQANQQQPKTQDLEGAEFQMQRKKSQSRSACKQISLEGGVSLDLASPRPQSYHEAPTDGRNAVVSGRKKRPLPPTPDQEGHSLATAVSQSPPVPKPRRFDPPRSTLQQSLQSNGAIQEDYEEVAASDPVTESLPIHLMREPLPRHPVASDYEVPVQVLATHNATSHGKETQQPAITHGRNSISAPLLYSSSTGDDVPPLPPPRRRGQHGTDSPVLRDNYDSVANVGCDQDYDTLKYSPAEEEADEGAYGHLMRIEPAPEEQYSQLEFIPINAKSRFGEPSAHPRSHSDIIPLSSSPMSVSPIPPLSSGNYVLDPKTKKLIYYENTGYVAAKDEAYTRLSFN